jgi:hypothetical protein
VNCFASGPVAPDGFVHREQQALITVYLETASLLVPEGFMVTLFNGGDFWVTNLGPSALGRGATVYAGYADGGAYSAAPSGASGTASMGSTNTAAIGATFTASASTDANPLDIDVTAVTGKISIGDTIQGTGILAGSEIVEQISGTTGGAGTYRLNQDNTTVAATCTCYGEVLVVSASTGLISIGDTVSGGSGFPVAAVITEQISGTTGGVGSYKLSAPATEYVASATGVTTFGNVLNVTAVTGTLQLGFPITATNIPATSLASQLTGNPGSTGQYTLFAPGTQYVASESFTTAGGIASGWLAYPTNQGDGAVGSLVKISKGLQ